MAPENRIKLSDLREFETSSSFLVLASTRYDALLERCSVLLSKDFVHGYGSQQLQRTGQSWCNEATLPPTVFANDEVFPAVNFDEQTFDTFEP